MSKCKYCGRETNPREHSSGKKMYAITPKFCHASKCKDKYDRLHEDTQRRNEGEVLK